MAYVNITTKEILTAAKIMSDNPNVSFPDAGWSNELLAPFGYAELHRPVTHPFPAADEKLVDGEPYEENGKWYLPWVVVKLTAEEIEAQLFDKRSEMVVSSFQAKAVLLKEGLLDDIEDYINNPDTDPLIKLAWNNVSEFRRLSPMIKDLAIILNLTDERLDKLFVNARAIEA